jgi:hypothetical protein
LNVEGLPDHSEVVVVLIDHFGNTIYSKVFITEHNNILLGAAKELHLSHGLYYISASSEQSIVTHKLFIK